MLKERKEKYYFCFEMNCPLAAGPLMTRVNAIISLGGDVNESTSNSPRRIRHWCYIRLSNVEECYFSKGS